MADAEARIGIDVDVSNALAGLRLLQKEIANFNLAMAQGTAAQRAKAQSIQKDLINNINASGKFSASIRNVSTAAESFTTALEKNKLSMGQYFRYAAGSTKTFSRIFSNEFNTIEKVARERVKTLQTQYIKLGRDANGAMKAIAVRPLALDMDNLATKTAIAAQKQAILNQLLKQGSTNLLNFGKNTQWAGRQLMVGFTIPLTIFGAQAARSFMQMEEQAIKFKRVYGDTFTATEETDKMIKQVKDLASEFTKYGVQVEKTMAMAADAAAMGKMGADLLAQINESTKLAVLGGVEQEKALETTISLTNSFGIAAENLASTIDFLNAVENQTVTAIEDLTIAIPKAAPVIKQLGGDVNDLAFFLTAMKEGGINASEGANALKSGLASLINPTQKAKDMLAGFGINIDRIVEGNAGNVKNLVIEFASALDQLDPLNRARAIEEMFGKFQFARISTLFQNVIRQGTQAQRVLELSSATAAELRVLTQRELKRVEDSPMYKFQKAIEDIKVSLVPLGEAFLKAVTPLIKFATDILNGFNKMDDGAKNFLVTMGGLLGVIGPVALMTFGLLANGIANLIKLFVTMGSLFQKSKLGADGLATSTQYLTQEQLEADAVAASLNANHIALTNTFSSETVAINNLVAAYNRAIAAQGKLVGVKGPMGKVTGPTQPGMKLARGIVSVPGPKGAGDIVPAMLSPGEAVIPARQSRKYAGLISGMINDNIPGFRFGLNPFRTLLGNSRVTTRMQSQTLKDMLQRGDTRYRSAFETGTGDDYINRITGQPKIKQQFVRRDMENVILGIPTNAPASARPTYGSVELTPMGRLISRLFGLPGKQFRNIAKPRNPYLDIYGDTELVGKRSLNKRSSFFPGDLLRSFDSSNGSWQYNRRESGITGSMLPPMRGASREQLEKRFWTFRHPFGKSIPGEKSPTGGQYFTSNPGYPYIESQVAGGFSLKEISKIRVQDRVQARQVQKLVDEAGLKIRVTPQNASITSKLLANLFGSRFSQGIVSFGGKSFRVASQAGADSLNSVIKMLLEKGYSQDRILHQLEYYAQKTIDTGKPQLTAKNIAKRFNLTTTGSSLARGSGKSAAPEWLRLMGQNAQSSFDAEREFLKKRLANRGISLTPGQLTNALQLQASHVVPELDKSGNKIWTNLKNIVPDLGYVNGYLNDLSAPNNSFMKSLLSSPDAILKSKGIDRKILDSFAKGIHPTTANEIKTLRAIAQEHMKFMGPGNSSFYRALMADEGLAFRQQNGYYIKPVSTYQQRVLSGQFKGSRKATSLQGLWPLKGKGVKKFASGVVSVPGPKGKGDVVPAMLSPGEAVIPTDMAQKYAPLISSMISDSIPGYFGGYQDDPFAPRVPAPPPNAGYLRDPFAVPDHTPAPPPENAGRANANRFGGQIADGFGKALGKSKAVASSLKNVAQRGVTAAGINVASAVQERVLRSIGQPGTYTELANGRIVDNSTRTTYKNMDAYNAAQARVKTDTLGREYGYIPGKGKVSAEEARQAKANNQGRTRTPRGSTGQRPGLGTAAGAIGGAAMTAGMMMSFSGDEQMMDIGNKVMMGGMALSILPMLANPWIAAAAAAAAAAAGIWYLNEQLNKARETGMKTAEAMSMTSDKLTSISEFTGTVSATDIRKETQAGLLTRQGPGNREFGQVFLEADVGKSMMTDIETQLKAGIGRGEVAKNMGLQLSQAIAQGVLTAPEAKSVAAALGQQINDYGFALRVAATVSSIVGPNGERLEKEPLKVAMQMQAQGQQSAMNSINTAALAEETINPWAGEGFLGLQDNPSIQVGAGAAGAVASGALLAAASFGAVNIWNPAGWAALALSVGLFANGLWQANQAAQKNQELNAAAIIAAGEQMAMQQKNLDWIKQTYASKILVAQTEIDAQQAIADTTESEEEKATALEKIKQLQQDIIELKKQEQADTLALGKASAANFFQMAEGLRKIEAGGGNISDTMQTAIDQKYKDDAIGKEMATQALNKIDTFTPEEGNLQQENFKVAMQLGLISGELSASTTERFINMATSNTQIPAMYMKLVSERGMADVNLITQLLEASNVNDTVFQTLFESFSGSGEDYNDMLNALSVISSIEGRYGVRVNLNTNGQEQLDDVTQTIQDLEDIEDPMTKEAFAEFQKKNPELYDAIVNDWDRIAGADDMIEKQLVIDAQAIGDWDAVQQYLIAEGLMGEAIKQNTGGRVVADRVNDPGGLRDRLITQYGEAAGVSFLPDAAPAEEAATEVEEVVETVTAPRSTILDNILGRLKQIRDASINATGGIGELLRILGGNKDLKEFIGYNQQLVTKGYGSEFIQFLGSLEEADRAKFMTITKDGVVQLTSAGKALNKAFAEATLGDFQFSLVQGLSDMNMSIKAMNILTGAGLSNAQAYEIATDAALAYAIATAATEEEIQNIINGFNALNKASSEFNTSTPEGYLSAIQGPMSQIYEYFSNRKALVELDFQLGTNESGLNETEDGITYGIKSIQDKIAASDLLIFDLNYQIDDLEYLLDGIQEQEDEVNEKYDKRIEALEEVNALNERALELEKSQLSVADALSSGDIAAAAKAALEYQKQQAANQVENQRNALELARESELSKITATSGQTRKEIEEEILDLKKQIAKEEENVLEPLEKQLYYANNALEKAKSMVENEDYLGKTEAEWRLIEAATKDTVTQTEAWAEAIKSALLLLGTFDEAGNFTFKVPDFKTGTGSSGGGGGAGGGTGSGSQTPSTPTNNKPNEDTKTEVITPTAAEVVKSIDTKIAGTNKSIDAINNSMLPDVVKKNMIEPLVASKANDAWAKSWVLRGEAAASQPAKPAKPTSPGYYPGQTSNGYTWSGSGWYASGGMVKPKYFNIGGMTRGTDVVPAMLTPGEFVVKRHSVSKYGTDMMKSINDGSYSGNSVYNYNLSVNVKSEANPDQIAQTVMTHIKRVNSQQIRSFR